MSSPTRVYNFSAGPAVLPPPVLAQVREELLDWQGCGMSVMEMSHRGPQFSAIAERAEMQLRQLLSVPEHYKVLFLQGGATGQFSSVAMNLAGPDQHVDYVVTGTWGKKAVAAARKLTQVHVAADTADSNYTTITPLEQWSLGDDAAYVHYTPNETIGGVEFHEIPQVGDVPLVADYSSTLLSRPIDVSRFGLIYAGAQKNIGPAGLTVVIVREDLLGHARAQTPRVMDYKALADSGSMLNTPPTFTWYVAGLVFDWIAQQGGLAAMGKRNEAKAGRLYAAIDASDFYSNPVRPHARSWMNVPFVLAKPDRDAAFLAQAAAAGLMTLKGHRSVGGMRASIYNAMPDEGVDTLIEFMREFERADG